MMRPQLSTMNLYLFLILSVLLAFYSCKKGEIGEDQKESFIKFYGTSAYDQAFEIKEVSDGYIMVGNTTRFGAGGESNTDVSIRKINEFGNELWSYSYGNDSLNEEANRFIIDENGNLLIAGFSTVVLDPIGQERRVLLMTVDGNGQMLGSNSYRATWSNPSGNYDSEGTCLIENDGFIYIGCNVSVKPVNQETPSLVVVLKIDKANPSSYEQRTVGEDLVGTNTVSFVEKGQSECTFLGQEPGINENTDVKYFAVPYGVSFDPKDGSKYSGYSPNGDNSGVMLDRENDLMALLSNNNINGSRNVRVDLFIIGTSGTNFLQWSNTFQIEGPDGQLSNSYANSFSKTTDGGFIVTGYTERGLDRDLFLLKIDSEGNKQWEQLFGSEQQNEQGESVKETKDGGYLILGSAGFDGSRIGNTSVMVIKTTSEGELK